MFTLYSIDQYIFDQLPFTHRLHKNLTIWEFPVIEQTVSVQSDSFSSEVEGIPQLHFDLSSGSGVEFDVTDI